MSWITRSRKAKLFALLKQIRHNTGAANIERRVLDAIDYVKEVGAKRQVTFDNPLYADPLLITRTLLKQPNVNEDTVVAAVIYGVFVNRLNAAVAPLDLREFKTTYMPAIQTRFGDGVAGRVLNALQIEEVSVLDRKDNVYTTATIHPKPPQSHAEQRLGIIAMVLQRIVYTDSVLIREAHRSARIDLIPPGPLSDASRRMLRTTDEVYVPIAFANGHRDMGYHLKEQIIRREDPSGYAKVREIKKEAIDGVAAAVGKGWIADPVKRAEQTLQAIEQLIEDAQLVQGHQKGVDYDIHRREKRDSSVYEKRESTAAGKKPDWGDIMAFRQVVKAVDEEAGAYTALRRLNKTFVLVRLKDFIKNPKDEYRALNATYEIRSRRNAYFDDLSAAEREKEYVATADARNSRGRFEIIVVGERMHQNNEEGTASHLAFKGYGAAAREVGRSKTIISVYLPNNEVSHVPKGATVADLAASVGAEFAFSVREPRITRGKFTPSVHGRNSLAHPLESGDQVDFVVEPNLAKSRNRRKHVINATKTHRARAVLIEEHERINALSEMGKAAIRPTVIEAGQISSQIESQSAGAIRDSLMAAKDPVTHRQSAAQRRAAMMQRRTARLVTVDA